MADGRQREDDDLPDTQLFWRWVGTAARPWAGWALIALAAVFILIGYLGVSRESLVAKQLPYFISGGVGGVLLAIVGAYFVGIDQIRRDSGRLDRLETMVDELHAALLQRPDAPRPAEETAQADGRANGSGPLFVLPQGQSFHRTGCAVLEGKSGATKVSRATIKRRKLDPCALCEPDLVEA